MFMRKHKHTAQQPGRSYRVRLYVLVLRADNQVVYDHRYRQRQVERQTERKKMIRWIKDRAVIIICISIVVSVVAWLSWLFMSTCRVDLSDSNKVIRITYDADNILYIPCHGRVTEMDGITYYTTMDGRAGKVKAKQYIIEEIK
jgi:hypothetical protein